MWAFLAQSCCGLQIYMILPTNKNVSPNIFKINYIPLVFGLVFILKDEALGTVSPAVMLV